MSIFIRNPLLIKIGLYFTSLFWFFVLLIICEFEFKSFEIKSILSQNIVSIISFGCIIVCIFYYFIFSHLHKAMIVEPHKIIEIEDVSSEQLAFLATYILPLILYDYGNIRSTINILVIMILIGLIFCKTNLFYANPTLSTLGFKVYKVKLDNKDLYEYIILKDNIRLSKNDKVYLSQLNDTTYFAHKI